MSTKWAISVAEGPDRGQVFALNHVNSLGRDRACGVSIRDDLISRNHGIIEVTQGEQIVVFSDRSRNGTFLRRTGQRRPECTVKQEARVLNEGDQLMLGRTILEVVPNPNPIVPEAPPAAAPPATVPASGPGSTASSVQFNSDEAQQVYEHPFTRLARERAAASRGAPHPLTGAGRTLLQEGLSAE